jgi:hypothetical protein
MIEPNMCEEVPVKWALHVLLQAGLQSELGW